MGRIQFRIVFTLPEATRPINVTCQSKRVYEYGENVHIGAAFVDSISPAIRHSKSI